MFLRDLLMSCLRRWYFLVVGLIVTMAGTYVVYTSIPPTYEANASMVLIPPKIAVTVGDNPYLYLGGLDQALGVLQVKMTSPEIQEGLTDRFQDAEIQIAKDATTSGPIIAIKVGALTEPDTMDLLDSVVALVPQTLASLQQEQKVPKISTISSMVLSQDIEPTAIDKRQIQMTAVVLVAGASASLLLTGLLDRALSGRKERKLKRKQAKLEKKSRRNTASSEPGATQETQNDSSLMVHENSGQREDEANSHQSTSAAPVSGASVKKRELAVGSQKAR